MVWWELLTDVDFDDAKHALRYHAMHEPFPPSIADIREGVTTQTTRRAEERLRLEQRAYHDQEPTIDTAQRQKLIDESRAMLKRLAAATTMEKQ